MWLAEQATLQAPQLATLVFVFTSHPFDRLSPSQSPQPVAHVPVSQLPPEQARVMFAVEHARLQPPQWATLVLVLISQPSSLPPVQSA